MSILQRYIAKTIMIYTALVMLVVIGLDFFIVLLTELRDTGTGDYGFWQAVLHAILAMPNNIYMFSPMLLLLGGSIGLGLLSSSHELVVMRASGVSLRQLMRAVAVAGIILIVIVTLLGELLAPQATFTANKRKISAENGGQAVATASGVWIHEGDSFLHIDRVLGHKHLEGVTRYQFDANHHLLAAYYVKAMQFKNGQWLLHDLVKTSFQQDHTKSEKFAETTWDLTLNPNLLNVGVVEPNEMSLVRLSTYSNHLAQNGQQASKFQFEYWKRIFQPLATLIMMLLAIPFVLNAPRSVTMGWRMLLGVIVGFVFYILNAFFGQVCVVYDVTPFVAAMLPTVLFAVVGYVVLLSTRA